MTPDLLKALFDGNAILVMFVWGLLCKHLPILAKVPNATIPWVNVIGYIIAKLAIPEAHAGTMDTIASTANVLGHGLANAGAALLLYEGWFRSLLQAIGLKKAVPR